MPTVVLGEWQVQTLLSMSGVELVAPHSPFRVHRRYGRPIAPGEPDWRPLVEWGIVNQRGGAWRVNSLIAGVLRAGADPDEVVNVGVGNLANPGFAVVRRGGLVAECTISSRGTTKLCFPITRSAVLLSLVSALSGDADRASVPSGFRFRGSAQDAFVLATALRESRADYAPLSMPALRAAVARDAANDRLVMAFSLCAGYEPFRLLANDPTAVDAAIGRLAGAHLVVTGTSVEPSAAAREALSDWPHAAFGLSHVEVVGGRAVTQAMQALRCGRRIVVFRPCGSPGGAPEFEWAEVTLGQLRALVSAFVLTSDQVAALTAPRPAVAKKAAPPRKRAAPAAPPERARPEPAPWAPTHVAPSGGTAAYGEPDPSAEPIARLGPRLPVQVTERRGAWAYVVCSNGWAGWVDGRSLEASPSG